MISWTTMGWRSFFRSLFALRRPYPTLTVALTLTVFLKLNVIDKRVVYVERTKHTSRVRLTPLSKFSMYLRREFCALNARSPPQESGYCIMCVSRLI